MLARLRAAAHPVEIGLLLGLCFFLPLLEAPKNLFWVAYVLAWLANRARSRDFGGGWDLWDTLIAVWIASGFVVAAFSGVDDKEWGGAGDLLRYGSVLWLVKRGGYSSRELRWLLGALVASVVVGIAVGYVRMWTGIGKSGTLQLHSVGHVNHTAIYIAILLGVCAAWVFARWRGWRAGKRAVGLAVTVLVLVALVETASRAAVGVGLAMLPVIAAAWWPRWKLLSGIALAGVAVVAAAAIALGAQVMQKQEVNVAADNVLSFRDGIWRAGLVAWERYPLFGVGMDNWGRITPERLKTWRAEAGKDYDPNAYYTSSHAHSLYVNTLAERGVVGAAALFLVLAAWGVFLFRYRPRRDTPDDECLLWGAAASAWMVTLGVGLVNTTLHHEHGLLAALLLGMWLSRLPAGRAARKL